MATYIVSVNIPGYLPESEPVECASWADAFDTLRGEMETTLETVGDATPDHIGIAGEAWDAALAEWAAARRAKVARLPITIMVGGFAHNIDRG